jgi:hypothetical protein
MKKIFGGLLAIAMIPQTLGAYFTNENFQTERHNPPSWFVANENGGFYGELTDGTTFAQIPVQNSLGIRMQKFEIDSAYFYISDRGVIYADTDIEALSIYFTLA